MIKDPMCEKNIPARVAETEMSSARPHIYLIYLQTLSEDPKPHNNFIFFLSLITDFQQNLIKYLLTSYYHL